MEINFIHSENGKLREYMKNINHKFIKNPNFKYKSEIICTNYHWGNNDMFEIYTSYKDNKLYIASPNNENNNLDIFSLLDNKKIISLKNKRTNKNISVKYFFNKKNNNEYLVSIDEWRNAYVWDISNNYQLKYKIDYDCDNCILIFLENNNDYIITSYRSCSYSESTSTKLYSFNDCSFIQYIDKTNDEQINYLLYWYNKMDNKNYIIQLAHGKILINNFIENKLYKELMLCDCSGCNEYFTGFIYNKENIDYLYTSSKGQIEIWDLFNKNLCKIFKNIGYDITCMIRWNYKYILICDVYNECLKVFDLKNEKVISSVRVGKEAIRCVKKFYHPFYGESILTADNNNKIKLWITYKEDKEEDINEKNNNLFNLLINDIPNIDENIKEFLNYEFTKNKNKELYIIYSLYKEKNDKDDFIESIEMYLNKSTTKKLITKFNLKKEIKIKLSKINDDDFLNKSNEIIKILKKFSLFEENDINLMINLINDKNDIFIAAFQVYFENEDFEEFYETISLALKFKNNK